MAAARVTSAVDAVGSECQHVRSVHDVKVDAQMREEVVSATTRNASSALDLASDARRFHPSSYASQPPHQTQMPAVICERGIQSQRGPAKTNSARERLKERLVRWWSSKCRRKESRKRTQTACEEQDVRERFGAFERGGKRLQGTHNEAAGLKLSELRGGEGQRRARTSRHCCGRKELTCCALFD